MAEQIELVYSRPWWRGLPIDYMVVLPFLEVFYPQIHVPTLSYRHVLWFKFKLDISFYSFGKGYRGYMAEVSIIKPLL